MKYSFPPDSLYQTICTAEMFMLKPGAPYWMYDGQFIWMPTNKQIVGGGVDKSEQ